MPNFTSSVLITGGSGLLGRHLTNALLQRGYNVNHLSRSPGKNTRVKTFKWDVNQGIIDEHCVDGVDIIIHLAGAGVADKRWTNARKREIIDSRVKSIELIYNLLKRKTHQVRRVISASGINYYGNRGDELLNEEDEAAHDFLAQCCVAWEAAVDRGQMLGLQTIKLRTGVVLTKEGGALPQLALPVKLGIGSAIGSGRQWVSWIHQQDVTQMYLHIIDHPQLSGAYNMVAPHPVTNAQLVKALAKQLKRRLWAPKVPALLIKILFGQMSSVVLGSTRGAAKKIEQTGFRFSYPDIEGALKEIYG